jgi:hypothetical protein
MSSKASSTIALNFEPSGLAAVKAVIATKTSPTLETVAKPNLTTDEIAHHANNESQTWRSHACYGTGRVMPLRVTCRIKWPTAHLSSRPREKILLGRKHNKLISIDLYGFKTYLPPKLFLDYPFL